MSSHVYLLAVILVSNITTFSTCWLGLQLPELTGWNSSSWTFSQLQKSELESKPSVKNNKECRLQLLSVFYMLCCCSFFPASLITGELCCVHHIYYFILIQVKVLLRLKSPFLKRCEWEGSRNDKDKYENTCGIQSLQLATLKCRFCII